MRLSRLSCLPIGLIFCSSFCLLSAQEPDTSPQSQQRNRPPAAAQPPGTDKPTNPAAAQHRDNNGMPPEPDQAAVDRGQKVFRGNCSFCHGADANGGQGGPDLIRSVLVNHDENGNLVGPVVLNGRPDKGMPKFNFTQAQVQDIATFLHARNRYVRYRQLYQTKSLVVGDAAAGKIYFNAHCASCHSAAGDLNHVATTYEAEALLSRMLYPGQPRGGPNAAPPDQRALPSVAVTTASGQTVTGKLAYMDDFTVSMHEASGEYHTWSREAVQVSVNDPLEKHVELLKQYTDADMHNLLAYLETLK